MSWETFGHEADVGVRGTGETLAEAFTGAAIALTSVVCDPVSVNAHEPVAITCEAPDAELLLVDWLNALVFEMATRQMLFSRFDLKIDADLSGFRLAAAAWGEPIDAGRHEPAAEVKGATYCELKVARGDDGLWFAQCVVDV